MVAALFETVLDRAHDKGRLALYAAEDGSADGGIDLDLLGAQVGL